MKLIVDAKIFFKIHLKIFLKFSLIPTHFSAKKRKTTRWLPFPVVSIDISYNWLIYGLHRLLVMNVSSVSGCHKYIGSQSRHIQSSGPQAYCLYSLPAITAQLTCLTCACCQGSWFVVVFAKTSLRYLWSLAWTQPHELEMCEIS